MTSLDWGLVAVWAAFVCIGLFKGFSGWLGTLSGAAVATATSVFAFPFWLAQASAYAGASARPVAFVIDFILGLVVFGLTRRLVARFVSFLVPQPLNALLGGLGAFVLGAGLIALLAATAILEGVPLRDGFVASHARLVHVAAGVLEQRMAGDGGAL